MGTPCPGSPIMLCLRSARRAGPGLGPQSFSRTLSATMKATCSGTGPRKPWRGRAEAGPRPSRGQHSGSLWWRTVISRGERHRKRAREEMVIFFLRQLTCLTSVSVCVARQTTVHACNFAPPFGPLPPPKNKTMRIRTRNFFVGGKLPKPRVARCAFAAASAQTQFHTTAMPGNARSTALRSLS